ncbi:ImmA/IrrE family metallo-endopeptidase [Oryzibacter oryziterrae]|uniref:ImmA/IrrE family metallo-endopeptidase n=1 Tax=Oryzibacter oryziterrae TaxID=2766474 RepID=UPI001F1917CA|nr:ImmA/IrrE family metallo-endopeptidase [Oryzibacter oryziterrae]
MRFSVRWLENAENRAPEEQATAAEFRIWLGDSNVTRYLSGEHLGTAINLPVYSIAEGLVLDWWRLFGNREEEVSLRRYRSGYAIPDIRMRFDGAAFDVYAEQSSYRNPEVRFWSGQTETMSREAAEATLGQFIGDVLDRMKAREVEATTAALRWERVRASMADPDERAFCEAAGALGEDPYNISDAIAAEIECSAGIFQDEALTEFLAGARGKDRHLLFEWIGDARKVPGYTARFADLRDLANQISQNAPARVGEPGWAKGYRRARACRQALGLMSTDRITTVKHLAEKLGNANFRAKRPVDGLRVFRDEDNRGVLLHLRSGSNRPSEAEQLFSLARGVGDVACFPDPCVAPINDLGFAFRQRCGRAFAAEFLAPVAEVRSMYADGRDHLTIANEFGVSELVVSHQLENEARIQQACAA